MERMTKREMFNMIMAETANEDIKAFCAKEIALLDSKAEKAKGKTSAHKAENDKLRSAILATFAEVQTPLTISQLMKVCPALEGMTNQKVTGLVTTLGEKGSGDLVRTVEKRVAYYSLAEKKADESSDSEE